MARIMFSTGVVLWGIINCVCSQKNQITYKVQPDRLKVISTDSNFIQVDQAKVVQHNETHNSMRINLTLFKDILPEDDIDVTAKVYTLKNGDYHIVPLDINFNFCDGYKYIASFVSDNQDVSDDCPITEGNYYMENLIMNEVNLQEELPKRWRKFLIQVNGKNADGLSVINFKLYMSLQPHIMFD